MDRILKNETESETDTGNGFEIFSKDPAQSIVTEDERNINKFFQDDKGPDYQSIDS